MLLLYKIISKIPPDEDVLLDAEYLFSEIFSLVLFDIQDYLEAAFTYSSLFPLLVT